MLLQCPVSVKDSSIFFGLSQSLLVETQAESQAVGHNMMADMEEIEIRDGESLRHSFHCQVWAASFPEVCFLRIGLVWV